MKKIIEWFRNWSTRKTTLWFSVFAMVLYTIIGTLYTLFTANYLDSTITASFFDAMKWVVGLGGGITVAKIVKGE